MTGRLALDLKMAMRSLTRSRFVSAMAITAIALGVAVTTAVFSIFNGVLLAPLPFPEPDRIVAVYDTQPACATCPASFPKYIDWRERNRVFSTIGGAMESSFVLTGRGDPVRVAAASTTASFSDVFGVAPQIGRWFNDDEDRAAGPKVVVLTHGFWVRQLGADPGIVGQKLVLDGNSYIVVGVMPERFAYRRAEIFVPLQRKLDPATRGNHFLVTFARLKPGVTLAQATGEMRALGRTLAEEFHTNHGVDVRSYKEAVVGGMRAPLTVLMGAVFLVLHDRVRERREPAAGLGAGAASRAGHPRRARRGSLGPGPAGDRGERRPRHRGRRHWRPARRVDRADVRRARRGTAAARRRYFARCARAGVQRGSHAPGRRTLRSVARRGRRVARAGRRDTGGGYADRQRHRPPFRQRPHRRRNCAGVRASRECRAAGEEPHDAAQPRRGRARRPHCRLRRRDSGREVQVGRADPGVLPRAVRPAPARGRRRVGRPDEPPSDVPLRLERRVLRSRAPPRGGRRMLRSSSTAGSTATTSRRWGCACWAAACSTHRTGTARAQC